jgi:osmotically-inducible protein OsmY
MKKIIIFTLCFFINGCVEAVIGGTVATVTLVSKNKNISEIKDDSNLKILILNSFDAEKNDKNYKNIDVIVYKERVMLTGYVYNKRNKKLAVAKAIAVRDGIEIIDEIIVMSNEFNVSKTKDVFINSQIAIKLKLERGITSTNYNYNVVGGVVFVIGEAKTENEMKVVTTIMSEVKGVNKVVSYIKII